MAHFDALFATIAQRRNFRHYLQGLLLPYVRSIRLFLRPSDAEPHRGSDDGGWWFQHSKCDKIDTKGSQKSAHAAEAPERAGYGRRSVFILPALALLHTRSDPACLRSPCGLAARPSRPGPLVVPLADIEQGVTA